VQDPARDLGPGRRSVSFNDMSGWNERRDRAVASKMLGGLLIAYSMGFGGTVAAARPARANERPPPATPAEWTAWVTAREDLCPKGFEERFEATRQALRKYPAAVRKRQADYERRKSWFTLHCPVREIGALLSLFACDTLEDRPAGLTVHGKTAKGQFVLKYLHEPSLDIPETLSRENSICSTIDPISLDLGGMRLVSSEPEVPSLTEELKTLVVQEMHDVEIIKIQGLVGEVKHRVRQIDLLCFRSTTKDCAIARDVLDATAAIRAEVERFEAAHREAPGYAKP
jgi:hypothetical protein